MPTYNRTKKLWQAKRSRQVKGVRTNYHLGWYKTRVAAAHVEKEWDKEHPRNPRGGNNPLGVNQTKVGIHTRKKEPECLSPTRSLNAKQQAIRNLIRF